jgi:hypothetical protein
MDDDIVTAVCVSSGRGARSVFVNTRPGEVAAAWRYRCRRESRESEHPSQFWGPRRSGLCSGSGCPDAQGNRSTRRDLQSVSRSLRRGFPMSSDQRPGWTRTSVRAASACSSLKTVRGSSDLRSRWMFRLRCGSPTFGRSETCSSSRRTDGSELVAPSSLRSERLRSHRARCGWSCRRRTTTTPALRLYADSGYALIKGYLSLMLPLGG